MTKETRTFIWGLILFFLGAFGAASNIKTIAAGVPLIIGIGYGLLTILQVWLCYWGWAKIQKTIL